MENRYSKELIEKALVNCSYHLNLDPFYLNIIGIRNLSLIKEKTRFKDRICAIINVYDSIKYFEFSATTKAYSDGFINSVHPDNFILAPGFYKELWKHSPQRTLVQRIPVKLLFGKDKKSKIDYEMYSVNGFITQHGVDLRLLKYKTLARKISEVACQYIEKDSSMHTLSSYCIMQDKGIGKRMFDYILMDDIDGILVATDKIYGEESVKN